jgi:hypothetical protein
MLKIQYVIVINTMGSSDIVSYTFESEPTTEDIEKFWKETLIRCTTDGSGDVDKLYPNVPHLAYGYAEVKKRYYWSQGSK